LKKSTFLAVPGNCCEILFSPISKGNSVIIPVLDSYPKKHRDIEARRTLGDSNKKRQSLFPNLAKNGWNYTRKRIVRPHERYEQVFRIHLSPRFGSRPIDQIKRDDLKKYFSELATSKKHGLEELLRLLSDTLVAENSGSMDTPSSAVHDLEAMEVRPATVPEATPTRG
jgi:hypothetical protein